MVRLSILSALVGLLLAGCASSNPPADPSAPQPQSKIADVAIKAAELKAGVVDFEMADLQEASRIAHDANDGIAYTCIDYLMTVVPRIGDTSNGKIDGPATAFMRARVVIKRVGDGPSDELKQNCAALYLDAKDDIHGVAGRIASIATKLGIKGFTPF